MSRIIIKGLPTEKVRDLQRGGKDENGNIPEVHVSDGKGNPCRHCLEMIAEGEPFYVLSHKPFTTTQPYAEQGPIFLHMRECNAFEDADDQPDIFKDTKTLMIRGYDRLERIIYGTGRVVSVEDIRETAREILKTDGAEFVHLRSSSNNCYQARMEKEN